RVRPKTTHTTNASTITPTVTVPGPGPRPRVGTSGRASCGSMVVRTPFQRWSSCGDTPEHRGRHATSAFRDDGGDTTSAPAAGRRPGSRAGSAQSFGFPGGVDRVAGELFEPVAVLPLGQRGQHVLGRGAGGEQPVGQRLDLPRRQHHRVFGQILTAHALPLFVC